MRSIGVRESSPIRITQIGSTHRCLIITTKLFKTISRSHLSCRVESQSSTNCTAICIAVVDIHTFCIQIESQMLIQESRREVQGSCNTLHARCLEDTILVSITNSSTIRHILSTTHNTDSMVSRNSSTIDLLLPISICSTQISSIWHKCTIFIACHYIQGIGQNTSTYVTVI